MFEAFRHFVTEFVDGGKHPSQFADDDYRLAAAALLVHTAAINGEATTRERDKLHAVIRQRFALDEAATTELIDKATAAEHEAVDLYHFTHLLNRTLDEEGRAKVIEMMWEIVYADGSRDELEDNLLWRAADLLGVAPRERIELRRRIAGRAGDASTDAEGNGEGR
ncbi:MAG: TerB family tellurite resistance protein [Xanthobacteraceae bacterium]